MSIYLYKRNDRFSIFLHLDILTKFRKHNSKKEEKINCKIIKFRIASKKINLL